MIPKEILKNKDIKAIGKLIIYFLLEQQMTKDGGFKTTIAEIATGIGEDKRNIKEHIKKLKQKNILHVKTGRYPVFYFKFSMVHHSVPLNDSIVPYSVPLKPATYINNVVVVLLEKYGFDFGPMILEKLIRFPVSTQIKAIESTKAYSILNPARYIERILDNDCKGIRLPDKPIVDQYAAEKERLEKLKAESLQAQQLGFKTAGYAH